MTRTKAKRQSDKRFEQLNALCDRYIQTLPKYSHRVAILVMWRHANNPYLRKDFGPFAFKISKRNLARSIGSDVRDAKKLIDELCAMGVIELVRERRGTIPRIYKLTWKSPSGGQNPTTRDDG